MFHPILLLFLEISELEFVIGFGIFLFFILTVFVTLFLVTSYKRKIKYKQKLIRLDYEKQQAILQTQIEIQEQTLKNISQEIHDNIGQVLSLAKLNLGTFPIIADVATQTKVEDTKQLLSKAIRDLRDLSRSMQGDKIAELGLQESISDELKIIQNTGKFTTSLLITGGHYKMGSQKEMVLFRMVQEALNNSIKHSRANNIEIKLNYGRATFSLSITDNGAGFNPASLPSSQTGIGLKNMQNRANLIGAHFSVKSNVQTGTQINIELKNVEA